jgi:ATP-dependent exoDNAse (exonuclease V) beta subunit
MKFKHIHTDLGELPIQISQDGTGKRVYQTPHDCQYPSITTVLSLLSEKAIAKWRKRVGEDVANAESQWGKDRGTLFHEVIERYLKNEDPAKFLKEYDPTVRILFNQARFKLNRISEIHAQETAVYSDFFEIAGRCDVVGVYDDVLSIIDFKGSGKQKKKEWIEHYFIQGAFYAYAYYERTGIRIPQIVIMISCEDGGLQIFKEKPYKWWDALKVVRKEYREREGI